MPCAGWIGACPKGFQPTDCLRPQICLPDDFGSPGSVRSCSSPRPATKPIGEGQGHVTHRGKASPPCSRRTASLGKEGGNLSRWESLFLING